MDTIDESAPLHKGKLVIVGSSAGGVEALSQLVSTLPVDFAAPILLAQHLDPRRPSILEQILQRRSHLPVQTITAHTPLHAGTIYVVPPDCYVTINDGYIEMQDHAVPRPKPSLDVLLRSAARLYGKRLIAVILTGSGSDGAAGAIEVKRAGGTVIIQNPHTARFSSMPSAILPEIVDFQVDVEDIGPLLTKILDGAIQTAEREHLENITPFFRDPGLFAFLKQTVLPVLLQRARSRERTLRCWVISCGSGEEAYSLAMVISDLLGADLGQWRVKIFATDLSEEAIHFARHGCYPENLLTGLPAGYQARFFTAAESSACVSKRLRQLLIFGKHDPSQDAPFPHIDLVLCRNALPFFSGDFQQVILKRLTSSLFPDGYLVLDREEKVLLPEAYYMQAWKGENIFRCIEHVPPAFQPPVAPSLLKSRPGQVQRSGMVEGKQPGPEIVLANEQVQPFYELLFRSLPVGLLVIDRTYHVLTANRLARQLLRMRTTPGEQDFFHAIPALPYQRVRQAVDTVFREQEPVMLAEVELEGEMAASTREVALSIVPLSFSASETELAVISVHDVSEQVQTRRHLEAVQGEQEQLINELGAANRHLQDVNKALMEAEQALQKTNEDLALAQQELQSQSEEQETTIEELQASLQEMEALNEEQNTTIEELQIRLELLEASQEASKAPDSVP